MNTDWEDQPDAKVQDDLAHYVQRVAAGDAVAWALVLVGVDGRICTTAALADVLPDQRSRLIASLKEGCIHLAGRLT